MRSVNHLPKVFLQNRLISASNATLRALYGTRLKEPSWLKTHQELEDWKRETAEKLSPTFQILTTNNPIHYAHKDTVSLVEATLDVSSFCLAGCLSVGVTFPAFIPNTLADAMKVKRSTDIEESTGKHPIECTALCISLLRERLNHELLHKTDFSRTPE